MSGHPVLPEKYSIDWNFYLSKLAQIVSIGPGIRPQKGQKDNFTREPPCLQESILVVPAVFMKPSLTSVSRRPDTHGSYATFMPRESTQISIPCKNQVWESQNIYACADGMFEQERKMQYLQTWRWSVVPNESSRDFGPCDRFWTQMDLCCFLLPTSPPGTALQER